VPYEEPYAKKCASGLREVRKNQKGKDRMQFPRPEKKKRTACATEPEISFARRKENKAQVREKIHQEGRKDEQILLFR